jgi:hypothetical protein
VRPHFSTKVKCPSQLVEKDFGKSPRRAALREKKLRMVDTHLGLEYYVGNSIRKLQIQVAT